ncbi:hypothetical protein DPMN_164320 [Dreissena polymorpha]|uniref:Uncharacterized protein n=1 Tax=Dreissena polymorpha TaxID=45954 RepID=A0A9D4ITM4_DREPO|nr:hypothetical protein DPMN_164320 [Dreissena polymorpha]
MFYFPHLCLKLTALPFNLQLSLTALVLKFTALPLNLQLSLTALPLNLQLSLSALPLSLSFFPFFSLLLLDKLL